MLGTKLKVFHESISFFMKLPWNCISWNALKEKFHRVCFPLENIFFSEVSESFLAHCYNWVIKCFMWSIKLLIVNFFKEVYIEMNINRSMLAHTVSCLSVHLQKQPSEVFYNKRCSIIKLCARVSFLIKTLAQVFSCEFCEISKNNFFTDTSGRLLLHLVFPYDFISIVSFWSMFLPQSPWDLVIYSRVIVVFSL